MANFGQLHWGDYVAFVLTLLISLMIGLRFAITSRNTKTSSELINAARSSTWFPVAASLCASFISAIALMGMPVEVYFNGPMLMYFSLSMLVVAFITSQFYVPIFIDCKVETSFQYLELRFNKPVRLVVSLAFAIQTIFYAGLALYTPSLAINQVLGLTLWGSIIGVGLVCTCYTAFGGLKAVLWTDVFQALVMFACLVMIVVQGVIDFGGYSNIVKLNQEGGRYRFDNFYTNLNVPYTFWSVFLGNTVTYTAVYGVSPMMVQRALSCKNLKTVKIAYYACSLGTIYVSVSTMMTGFVLYAEYGQCVPTQMKGSISATDQIVPLYVATKMSYPGVVGLFIAGVFAAALSTLSSTTNSMVAVTMNDLIGPLIENQTRKKKLLLSKMLGILFGLLTIAFAFISSFLGAVLVAVTNLFSIISGPILGVFTAGIFFPFTNSKGAFAGHILGTALTAIVGSGSFIYPEKKLPKVDLDTCDKVKYNNTLHFLNDVFPEPEYTGFEALFKISYFYISVIGFLLTLILCLLISAITGGNKDKRVNSFYLSKYGRKWFRNHLVDECPMKNEDEPDEDDLIMEQIKSSRF